MLRRLDVIREEQIEAARQAFANNPAALELVEQAVAENKSSQEEAVDPEVCFETPTARCLLNEAIVASGKITKVDFRDWALGDIATAQAVSGDVTGALTSASRMADARLLLTALGKIARVQARAGNFAEERLTAQALPDNRMQAEALLELASAEFEAGRLEDSGETLADALAVAEQIDDVRWRIGLLSNIAVIQMKAGDPTAAAMSFESGMALAGQLRSAGEQSRPLGEIASAQVKVGNLGEALDTVAQIEDADHRTPVLILAAEALADSGNIDDAFETAISIQDARYRVVALGRVAVAQQLAGKPDAARSTVSEARAITEGIEFGYAYSFALSRLVQAQAQIGDITGAMKTAEIIEDERLRAHAFWSIAAAQIKAGDDEGGRKTTALAIAEAESVTSGLDRTWSLCEIALEQHLAGEKDASRDSFQRGLSAARTLKSPTFRARAFAKLADTLVRLNP